MDEINQAITFRQLLGRCPRIEVPLIQRDYAQGRDAEKEVREHFLKALHAALVREPDDAAPPLNLDFIYGSMENDPSGSFFPLDGQQRLTTLFLLHWYLAWCDGQHVNFEGMLWDGKHSRFTYGVRPSSTEFFDELVRYRPDSAPDDVPALRPIVEDQPWFFSHWRLDPTIQSALVMLDDIHHLFKLTVGLFERLTNNERPAITFQLLPLEHFGLTDDLYIKMNARGKPLTPFETFKARFEELLIEMFPTEKRKLGDGEVSVAEFVENRIDTRWTNFFWAHKNAKTNTFDDLVINLLLALARVSLNPAAPKFNQDTSALGDKQLVGTFALFHERGWLTRGFTENLINLLDAWSRGGGKQTPVLPNSRYFDEAALFQKAIQQPATLDYTELVQFAAFVLYLGHEEDKVQSNDLNEWMRVVRNLSVNTAIERPEEYGRSLSGLLKLLPHSTQILEHLSNADVGSIGFSLQQVREEVLKSKLILADAAWRGRIDSAEEHGYFFGQIEFLLDFCGVLAQPEKDPRKWGEDVHAKLQTAFDLYLKKAQITFSSFGLAQTSLAAGEHLWKRALLVFGDYLLSNGSNSSFLTDSPSNWDSWKRLLRGDNSKRAYLKTLWDRLDADAAIEPQLNKIITTATNLEPWRAIVVGNPEIIAYCGLQKIRREASLSEAIYLLKKKQMNGKHAELFSYGLHVELGKGGANPELKALGQRHYESVSTTDVEPHIVFMPQCAGQRLNFIVVYSTGQFIIKFRRQELIKHPEFEAVLCGDGGFAQEPDTLTRRVSRSDIHDVLRQVASALLKLST